MLTYKNDPHLLNGETVNDLIEGGKTNMIFLHKGILNLYSALVRKEDFIKKDKIVQPLQKTLYVKIPDKWVKILNNRFIDKKEILNKLEIYIERRSNIKNIGKWFNTGIFPLVILRLITKDIKEFAEIIKEGEYFTDFANRLKCTLPKTINDLLTIKNAYLVGCSIGDGHISPDSRRWVLVDGTSHKNKMIYTKKFVENLQGIININYLKETKIREKPSKCELTVNSKVFCRFLNFFFGLPISVKISQRLIKSLIFKLAKPEIEKELTRVFWRGCFDSDGFVNKNGGAGFCSFNTEILEDCKEDLNMMSLNTKINHQCIRISVDELLLFTKVGFAHPRKQIEFLDILKRGPVLTSFYGLNDNNLYKGYFDIEKINGLYVFGCRDLIKELIKELGMYYKDIAKKLVVSLSTFNRYLQNDLIPLKKLIELAKLNNISKERIYDYLQINKIKYKSIGRRNFVSLPLSPNNQDLLYIVSFLKPWSGRVRINFKERIEWNISIDEIKKKINEVFGNDFEFSRKGNAFYFRSVILSKYLGKFFNYRPLWKAIEEVKKEEFIKQWNKPIN